MARVTKLKKVMAYPKCPQTNRLSLIPIKDSFLKYAVKTRGLTEKVPSKSVKTKDVTRTWNKDAGCFLRRISNRIKATTFPRTPAENIIADVVGDPLKTCRSSWQVWFFRLGAIKPFLSVLSRLG
ncbi:hypothetical protein QQF64_016676 [Cirrhinus molitorella]|uniref:Uncharacterized protein n=1 Tax=Cirrhinus molitorella TaxID=172907 RepID=A0ABR3LNG6_9TELE